MNPTPHVYILFTLAAILVVLALWMLAKYQRSPSIIFYSTMFLGLAGLAVITALILLSADDGLVLFLSRLGYVFGVVVFSMMLMFSWHYPIPSARIPRQADFFWALPLAFFLPLTLFSSAVVIGIERFAGTVREVAGPGFFVFPFLIGVYLIWTIANLVSKIKMTAGEQRKNLQFVTLALLLGAGSAVIFDAVLPYLGWPVKHYVSIETSSALIGLTAYIVIKK